MCEMLLCVSIIYLSPFFFGHQYEERKGQYWDYKRKTESKEIRVIYFGSFKELVCGLARLLYLSFTYFSKLTMGFLRFNSFVEVDSNKRCLFLP